MTTSNSQSKPRNIRASLSLVESLKIASGEIPTTKAKEIIDNWVEQKVDLYVPVEQLRYKTLTDAIIHNHPAPMTLLSHIFDAGFPPNRPNRRGERPVLTAARKGDWPLVIQIADRMDPSGLDSMGADNAENLLMMAALTDDTDVVRRVAAFGCRSTYESSQRGYNVLGYYVAKSKNPSHDMVEALIELVKGQYLYTDPEAQAEAFVNKPDITGASALLSLAKNGNTEGGDARKESVTRIVEGLLKSGARIDQADKEGYTPLLWATINGDTALVRVLTENGARLSVPNEKGVTPLLFASENNLQDIADILLQAGAEPDFCPPNSTHTSALNTAAANKHWDMAERLVRYGADPCVRNGAHDGHTPSIYAVKSGNLGALETFLAVGADPDMANEHGFTPLMYVASEFNKSPETSRAMMKALLSAGANPFAENKRQETVFDILTQENIRDGLGELWYERNIAYLADDSYDGDIDKARGSAQDYEYALRQKLRSGPIEGDFAAIDYMREQKEIDADHFRDKIHDEVREGRRLLASQLIEIAAVGAIAAFVSSGTGAEIPQALAKGFGFDSSTIVGSSTAVVLGVAKLIYGISTEDREKIRMAACDMAIRIELNILAPARELFANTTLYFEGGARAAIDSMISVWDRIKGSFENLAKAIGLAGKENVQDGEIDLTLEDVRRVMWGMDVAKMEASETKIDYFRRSAHEHGLDTQMSNKDLGAMISAAAQSAAALELVVPRMPARARASDTPFVTSEAGVKKMMNKIDSERAAELHTEELGR